MCIGIGGKYINLKDKNHTEPKNIQCNANGGITFCVTKEENSINKYFILSRWIKHHCAKNGWDVWIGIGYLGG